MNRGCSLGGLLLLTLAGSLQAAVRWNAVLRQPDAWYASPEAAAVATTVLLHQDPSGGWPKNRDMTIAPAPELHAGHETDAPTIDNGATWTQLRFLARVHTAQPDERWRSAFLRGLDYVLAAQYENGGWPQFYPLRPGYYTHITFNDDATVRVLEVLRDIAHGAPEFAFVDEARRHQAADAVRRGLVCILKCQVRVDGRLTVWCAQHDENTFAPAPARKFEPVSLSGAESVGIMRFLLSVEQPSPEIIASIEAAAAWFEVAKITGIRIEHPPAPELPHKYDTVVVSDPNSGPLWARFYEIGSNRPIFSGRDSVIHYALAEIEGERRGGYNWYTDAPARLLSHDYPRWRQKNGRP